MKKIFVLALMSLVFFAVSCGKEKDEPKKEDEKHSIEGTWYLEDIISKEGEDKPDDCSKKSYMTYSKGKGKTAIYGYKNGECVVINEGTGTYTISGNTITSINDKTGTEEKVTFSINGNTITFTNEKGSVFIWKKR